MPKNTFQQNQLKALDQKLEDLARDYTTIQFLDFRLFTLKDTSLYPKDWKKLSKLEKDKWTDNTQKRITEQTKGILKEVSQLSKFIKSLNK